jgi:hypothetical protein
MKQTKNRFWRLFGWLLALCLLVIGTSEYFFNTTKPSQYQLDPELGWTLKPNFMRNLTQSSLDGKSYSVSFSTNENGLRTHGDLSGAKTKILVLGDSHTAENYVSNNAMWYSVMVDRLNATQDLLGKEYFVWAGGGGGWGSYQELLLLKRLLRQVRPDIFILQFCENDFVNNHKEWESISIVRSQKYRRPYLDSNGTPSFSDEWKSPLWRNPVLGGSRTFNFIDILTQIGQSKYYGGFGPALDKEVLARYKKESIAITQKIISQMRAELGSIPAFMVSCSSNEVNNDWIAIAKEGGFIPLPQVFDALHPYVRGDVQSMVEKKPFHPEGSFLHADAGHLSARGNFEYGVVTADALIPYLRQDKK